MNINKIKVLVVDNSLFMRQLITQLLESDLEMSVVGTASSGEEAIRKISKLNPDVLTLDINMPGLNGLETLKRIMENFPTPVVMLSAYSHHDADISMNCLDAGAVSFVAKPSGELSLDIDKVKEKLLMEIRNAFRIGLKKTRSLAVKKPHPLSIVCIGCSTGGHQALEAVLSQLPANFSPPIIVIQHTPEQVFTQSMAKYLDTQCTLVVKEAGHNEKLQRGVVYLVPGGQFMNFSGLIHLSECKPEEQNRTIDKTMQSIANHFKESTIGVILTGMGHDGVEGMREIKKNGGKTICEDESAMIFGMPKAVMDQGIADLILPAHGIGNALIEWAETENRKGEGDGNL